MSPSANNEVSHPVSLEMAQVVVAVFEAYALVGVGFALLFLPRAVARLDPGVGGAPTMLRLLIFPGTVALWPLFAWRWITGAPQPDEDNPHRAKARESHSDIRHSRGSTR